MDRLGFGIGIAIMLLVGSIALLAYAFKSEPDPCHGSDEDVNLYEREDEIEKYNREWLDKPLDHGTSK